MEEGFFNGPGNQFLLSTAHRALSYLSGKHRIMPKLLLNGSAGPAQELHLKAGLTRLGRNETNDIQIEHPSVSSFHCEITCAADTVLIKDLGSTNGTFI